MTSGLTHVQRFSGLTRNLEKFLNTVQNFSAAQWEKFGDIRRQIFTTRRQFCRPVHSYFRPWPQVSSGCYLWVNQCSSYRYTLISSAT